jgi:hypothetical protein
VSLIRATRARAAVPWLRMGAGIVSQVAPRSLYPLAAIRPTDNADAEFIMRAFGAGALALGAISSGLAGDTAGRKAMRMGAVMDLVDVGTLWRAYRQGKIGTVPVLVNTVGGIVFSTLGFIGSRPVKTPVDLASAAL